MDTTPDTADGTSEPPPATPSTPAPATRRGSGRGASTAAASPQDTDTPAPGSDDAAAEGQPDTSGWFRNDSATAVTVTPHGAPSAYLRPGAAAWLPSDPGMPFLVACDGPTEIEAGPGPADTETEA